MKKEKPLNMKIDDLLKQVLKDDLPPESESRMRRHFAQFRKKFEQPDQQSRTNVRWQWAHWVLRKEVLALSSIIMVVLGVIMHMNVQRSVLAETVLMLRTSVSVSDQVRHTGSMECSVQVPTRDGQFLAYSIQWISPNMTRVDVQKANEIDKTLWISKEDIFIADHIKNVMHKVKGVEQIKDPLFQPVMEFLSPVELAERMYRRWQIKQYKPLAEQERGSFTFKDPNHIGKSLLEMIVDLNTYLPLSIKKFLPGPTIVSEEETLVMQLHFTWNKPVSPQIMTPKIKKRSLDA